MGRNERRLVAPTRLRSVRALTALVLVTGLSSTGFVAIAAPAHAAAAAPSLDAPLPPAVDSNPTPTVTFSGLGTAYECSFQPAAAGPSYAACTSPWTATALSPEPDGGYTIAVREVSSTNDGTPALFSYTLDTTATITLGEPATPGNNPTPSWTIGLEPGGTATCTLSDPAGATVGAAGAACSSGFTVAAPLTAEGAYTLVVNYTDGVGNTGTKSSTYTLDLTPPATPTPVGSQGLSNVSAVSWSWTAGTGDTASCTLTGPVTTVGPTPCTTATTFSTSVSDPGDYQLSVTLTDPAGNVGAPGSGPVYTYDNVAPAAPVFQSGPPAEGTDKNPTWTFTTPGTTTTCSLSAPAHSPIPLGSCQAVGTAPGTASGTNLPDDTWTLTVTTTDAAGNSAATPSSPYRLDTTGPLAPVVLAPSALGNNATPRFTWTGELPSTAVCRQVETDSTGAVLATGAWLDCTAEYFDLALTHDGYYQVEARLTDPLGNVGAVGTSGVYQYDGTAPGKPVVSGPAAVGYDTTPTFTFAVEPNGSAACQLLQGTTVVATASCSSGSYTPTLVTDGAYTVSVVASDQAGNASVPGTRDYTLNRTAPAAAVITAPASPGNTLHPSWGIAAADASTLTCRMLAGTVQVASSTGCQTGYVADMTDRAVFPDGTYTLEITSTSAAGLTTVITSGYELDTTAPVAPSITSPPSPGNAVSPTWTFVVQPRTTAQCSLLRGSTVVVTSDCSSGSFTASALADGAYTLAIQVTDTAGNAAPLATSPTYTSDRTAPLAPSVTGPSGTSSNAVVTWSWTGESGTTATCELQLNGASGTPSDCSSGSFSPSLVSDGSYVVVVQLKDAAGNLSAATSSGAYLLDRGAPAAPVVSGPTGPSSNGSPVWTWTAEAGATASCLGPVGATWTPCASGQSFPLPADGSYQISVRLTDAAGNTSGVGTSLVYVYDGTAPAAPVVTAPASPSNVRTATFSFVAEAGTRVECRVLQGTVLVADWTTCTSPKTLDLTGQPDAGYVVQARQTDAAGNVSPIGSSTAYLLDTTAPDAPVVSGPTGPATLTTPQFTFTGEPGTTGRCRLVHDDVAAATASACSSPYTPTLSGDGRWVVRVRLIDAAGNISDAGTSPTYVLDTTAPTTPVVTGPASPGRGLFPSWSAVVEPGTTVACRLTSGSAVLSDWSTCTLPLVTDLTGKADGSYVLSVRSTDTAGLTSPEGSATYVLDTTAPAAPVLTATPPSPSRLRTGSYSFTAESGTVATCRSTHAATVLASGTCTSPASFDLTGQPDGSYSYSVRSTDAAGNAGATASAVQVLDTTAPVAPVLLTGPAAVSPVRTPSWTFEAETGATLTCRVTASSGVVVLADRTCSSPFTADLRSHPDDTYTFSVRATDAAGNTGPALTSAVTLNSSAVAPPVVVAPASPSRDATPVWKVSSATGSAQCRLVLGTTVLQDWTACGPTYSRDLSSKPDGTYVLHARTVTPAGKLSSEVLSRYLFDTTAPAAVTLVAPASPSTDRAPTWTLSSPEAGATATCEVLRPGGAVARSFAPCAVSTGGSPFPFDLSGAVDGSWTLVVHLSDAAGNVAPEARSSYVLDTTAPAAVLVQAPPSPSSVETPTWLLTGDTDAVLECRLSGPGTAALAFAPCTATPGVPGSGSYTADLTTLPDGTYTLSARSRDAAGNLGPEVSSGYAINRLIPSAVPDLLAPASPSQSPTATFTFTPPPATTALCTLRSATAVVIAEQVCTSPVTENLTALGDGDYSLSVRVKDTAGNLSPASVVHYVFDTTPPAAPVITASPGSPSPSTTPAWALSASAIHDQLSCELVGLPTPTWQPCTSPVTYDLGTAASGSFTLQVREVDLAGNISPVTSSATYVLDPAAPPIVTVSPPSPVQDSTLKPVFTVVRDPLDTRTDHLDCTVVRFDTSTPATVPCSFGTVTLDLTGLTGQGPVVLSVRAVDKLGNVGAAASATYLFDGTAPLRPVLLAPSPSEGFDAASSWSWAGPADARSWTCELHKDGASAALVTLTSCTSPFERSLRSWGTGLFTLSVWSVDAAGNRSLTPAQASYRWLPPVPAGLLPRGPATGTDSTPTWTFTVPTGYSATCLLSFPDGSAVTSSCTPAAAAHSLVGGGAVVGTSTGSFTANLGGQPGGTYSLAVRLTDAFGHDGAWGPRAAYRYSPVGATPPGVTGPVGTGGGSPQGPGAVTGTGPGTGGVPAPPTSAVPGAARPALANQGPNQKPLDRILFGTPPTSKHATATLPIPGLTVDAQVPKAIKNTLAEAVKRPTIPLLLLLVVLGFLLLQNQIDRRDPKLASAPVGAEPELDFGPALGGAGPLGKILGGGAPA